jgi:hypothetical protein
MAHYLHALADLAANRLNAAELGAQRASRMDPGRRLPEIDQLLGVVAALKGDEAAAIWYLQRYIDNAGERNRAAAARRQLRLVQTRFAKRPV